MTGGEFIVPQIASSRFVVKAKFDGVVTDVIPGETMTVMYNNGQQETLDIQTRKSNVTYSNTKITLFKAYYF